ncbi:S24 family peptidase [Kushneria sp. TE3]|uniref:S24 family peptidase n=1 Tax=Kushneria sp. TE3 TaxID=3449832 RepID=UPI003F684C96
MSSDVVDNIPERLREELARRGYSLAGAARAIGDDSSQSLRDTLAGRKKCTAELLARLSALGIDTWYVLVGVNNHASSVQSVEFSATCSTIPIYDIEAAAGSGRLFDAERIDRHIPLDSQWLNEHGVDAQHVVALTAVGDSMADTVNEGDVILVDRSRTKPDGVFLVRVGDELRIKRVQRMAGGALSLVSDNRKYEPELITPEMLGRGEVEVIGQVFGHLGRVS